MAVIKSGDSTDQLHITPAKAALVDGSGATQPISAASLPLPAGAAQDSTLTGGSQKTQIIGSGNTAAVDATGDLQVDVNNFPTASASEGLTGNAVPADATLIGLNQGGTLVSAKADTNGNLNVNISDVGGNAATTKGVQPAAAIPTQDLKDSGRSKVILTLTKATSITTEALVTLTQKKGDAAPTTGTSYTVTAGKTLRLQSMFLSATLTVAGITAVAARLREGAAGGGALSIASDIINEIEVSCNIATIGVSGQQWANFPDGLEIIGGQTIGVSELATTVDAAVTIVIIGYEY